MIIERYIIREIFKPTVIICALLMFIFGSYIASRYWADAAQGRLPGSTVTLLILLRVTIALEVLLPTTLYLSVVITLSHFCRNAEMMAMSACGIGMVRVLKAVFMLSSAMAVLVACFSVYIRPWAWDQFFRLKSEAKANFDMTRMKGGTFYDLWHGEKVIFAEKVDSNKNQAQHVFIQVKHRDTLRIISADGARQYTDKETGKLTLVLSNGNRYSFLQPDKGEIVLGFQYLTMPIESRDIVPEHRVKAASTVSLIHSDDPKKKAELGWRLMAPFSTVLLALLGVALSLSAPRPRDSSVLPMAILIFALYYNFSAIIKKWVAQGIISPFPGVWWGQILLLILFVTFLKRPSFLFLRQ
jgi:lipopolysaccharide export system permease protein